MNALLAMQLPHTDDSSLYLLRLPQLLFMFGPLVLLFYVVLGIWVFRTVRAAYRKDGPEPSGPARGHADTGISTAARQQPPDRPSDLLLRSFGSAHG